MIANHCFNFSFSLSLSLSLSLFKHLEMTENNKDQETSTTTITTTTIVPKPLTDANWSALDSFQIQDDNDFEEALIPPENFNMVCEHIYRSSFPKKKHIKFLEKLKLKSVL